MSTLRSTTKPTIRVVPAVRLYSSAIRAIRQPAGVRNQTAPACSPSDDRLSPSASVPPPPASITRHLSPVPGRMPPYQGGGDMISSVTFEKTIYNKLPYKFEAGTPHVAGAIGLGAAIEYVNGLGMDNIAAYEHGLLAYATEAVSAIPGIRLIGTAKEKAGVLSFLLDRIHPHDIGTILDQEGVAIRTGP